MCIFNRGSNRGWAAIQAKPLSLFGYGISRHGCKATLAKWLHKAETFEAKALASASTLCRGGGAHPREEYAHHRMDRVLFLQLLILQSVRFGRVVIERIWFLGRKVLILWKNGPYLGHFFPPKNYILSSTSLQNFIHYLK